ncbi:hypothetical protein EBR21_11880, partial [bacterium]|nr:hypothetical protein [bacterium]
QDVVVAKETPVNGQDVVVAKETPVNGQDATGLALKCRTSGGIPLEFCVEGVQVDCVKGAKGEFCTQYVSESDGQM